jgi:hypothetical protein
VKGHSTFSNFFSTPQLGRLTCHQDRFGSQGYLLTECVNRVRLQPPEPHPESLQQPKDGLNEQLVQQGSHWMIHKIRLAAGSGLF